jgi:hypothetical protein
MFSTSYYQCVMRLSQLDKMTKSSTSTNIQSQNGNNIVVSKANIKK